MTNIATIHPLALQDFSRVAMNPSSPGWWAVVPAKPGWYAIETNAPFSAFRSLPIPSELGKRYKLGPRVEDAKFLIDNNSVIAPSEASTSYVIYSGEHGDLKARAREHTHGKMGTGCLCLSQYSELFAYQWTFLYLQFETHVFGCSDNKLLRTFLEQKWRAENGWPVLCSR